MKRRLRAAATVLGVVLTTVLIVEVLLRYYSPQVMLSPRFDVSVEYGIINFPDVEMRHVQPGVFDLRYSTNSLRHRGRIVPIPSTKPKIVSLGDSYTFGIGVSDENVYTARLQGILGEYYQVVNLGNGGWGLGQEIRRFITVGEKYRPAIVTLQFCANDLEDNVIYRVTDWDDEASEFVFREIDAPRVKFFKRVVGSLGPVYTLLTGYSQTYNLLRDRVYQVMKDQDVGVNAPDLLIAAEKPGSDVDLWKQNYHCDLLSRFAEYLGNRGIHLMVFSVEGHMARYPIVQSTVNRLQNKRLLTYLETDSIPTFGKDRVAGHWGARTHELLARVLAERMTTEGWLVDR